MKKGFLESEQIHVEEFHILVERKSIKNMYLRILPSDNSIRISAPEDISREEILDFAHSHLDWIRSKYHRPDPSSFPHSAPLRYVTGETVYIWGQPLMLEAITSNAHPHVELDQNCLQLFLRPDNSLQQRKKLLLDWYRTQLRTLVSQILAHWEPIMQVQSREFHIKIMKTRWGTCNVREKRIWINLYLVQKPLECVEYVVVHELCHLIEPSHSKRFYYYMDRFLPDWKEKKKRLNEPLSCIF